MDIFPAYRTYSRAAANRHHRRNDINQLLFTENTFETLEISDGKKSGNNSTTGKKKEDESNQPDASTVQKKKAPAKTKCKTSVPVQPVRQRGLLKKGRQARPIGKSAAQPKRRTDTQRKPGFLPKEITKSFEKVTEWLQKSHEYVEEESEEFPSKEVMRGEEQVSGEQRRQKLFDFQKMWEHDVPGPTPDQSQDTQLKKQDFFAQLRKKTGGLQPTRRAHDDTPITHDLQPCHTHLPEIVEPSQYTSQLLTTAQSSDADMCTDANEYTATPLGDTSQRRTHTTDSVVEGTVVPCSKQFLEPPTGTVNTTDLQKRKPYLSSTAKFDGKDTPKFPTDISAIKCSDISARKKKAEKTPQKSADFKVPGSPSKRHVKSQRKGRLEPKHSTRLFTTGFEELTEAFPQMSTIRLEDSDAAKTLVSSHTEAEEPSADLELMDDNQQEPCPIKTSTPNKLGSKSRQQGLEFDVSSVGADSGDDLLQINKSSHEVNSEEIINLSDIMVDPDQDPMTKYKELKAAASKGKDELSKATKTHQSDSNHDRGSFTECVNEETIHQAQHLPDTPANIHNLSLNKSSHKSFDKENRVSKQPTRKRAGKRATAGKAVRRRYASLPGLSTHSSEKKDAPKKNRSCHMEDLQKHKPLSQNLKRPYPEHNPRHKKVSHRAVLAPYGKGVSSNSGGSRRKQVAVVEPYSKAANQALSAVLAEDHGIQTCSLTTPFSSKALNMCKLQVVEKKAWGYQDLVPVDDLL